MVVQSFHSAFTSSQIANASLTSSEFYLNLFHALDSQSHSYWQNHMSYMCWLCVLRTWLIILIRIHELLLLIFLLFVCVCFVFFLFLVRSIYSLYHRRAFSSQWKSLGTRNLSIRWIRQRRRKQKWFQCRWLWFEQIQPRHIRLRSEILWRQATQVSKFRYFITDVVYIFSGFLWEIE